MLTRLRVALLGMNGFRKTPEVVSTWSQLETLDLTGDPTISISLPDQGHLLRISTRTSHRSDINVGALEELPTSLRNLGALRTLLLHGNPTLAIPDEILGSHEGEWDGSVSEILDYYFRTRGGARPLNEAKLLLLGWGGAGKTSLARRLLHDRFDPYEKRTEGIEVSTWSVTLADGEGARLNVWDFGGQEIMHATHQFFLSTRSLYLIVLNGRAGTADSDAEYWLQIVNSFAPGSPVIVALNQIAKDPFDLDETGLKQKYPNIREFVKTDCGSDPAAVGIDELRAAILRETDLLPDLRVNFPAAWFEIKNRLATMAENYLSFERYRELCGDMGETDRKAQEQLATYLDRLGIAVNYRDDPRLRDTHVLNPHWVTDGIYSILNSRLVSERAGEITADDLSDILDGERFPPERHAFLLELMRKFELCFAYADEPGRYLVAELLPKQQPETIAAFPMDGALHFEYRYPVLPEGLLPRFIVRSHVHSQGQPRWRTGAVLQWEDNEALVRADITDRVVRVAVTGPTEGRRRLLAVIRSDFEHIHRNLKFPVEELVPVPSHSLSVRYDKLLAAEKAGRARIEEFANGVFIDIDVAKMLAGVNVATTEGKQPRVKLFISYSHKDQGHREQLDSHLKVLQRAGLVEVWHDRRIDPGDEWKGEIDKALEDADIVLALVSSDFLASDYVNDVELPLALKRHEAGQCRVVPVVVRDVNWKHSCLAHLQALPAEGKAVGTWDNTDTAWRNVADGLVRVVEDLASR